MARVTAVCLVIMTYVVNAIRRGKQIIVPLGGLVALMVGDKVVYYPSYPIPLLQLLQDASSDPLHKTLLTMLMIMKMRMVVDGRSFLIC